MTTLIKKARDFAKKAHNGQNRLNGKDYFTEHCEVVANYVQDNLYDLIPSKSWETWSEPTLLRYIMAAAYLHDVLEDTRYTLEDFPIVVQKIVQVLTRKEETYFDYIRRIPNSGPLSVACVAIKLADLKCNIKDLKEGSMKDKYRFAIEMLSREL